MWYQDPFLYENIYWSPFTHLWYDMQPPSWEQLTSFDNVKKH